MQAKTKKIVIISSIVGGLALLGTIIAISSKRKRLQAKINAGSSDIITPAKATVSSVAFPLKKGSGTNDVEKDAVKVVQRYVNALGLLHWWLQVVPLTEDGLFGPQTEASLYKLASVKQVDYSLYLDMQNYLIGAAVPESLSPNRPPYQEPEDNGITSLLPGDAPFIMASGRIDPKIQKNNLLLN
jgi:hypothetical protein